MTVVPIRVADLRPAAAGDAAAGRVVARAVAALPRRIVADVGTLGVVELTLEGSAGCDVPLTEHLAFGVGRGRVEGRLLVDATFARRLINTLLLGSNVEAYEEAGAQVDEEAGAQAHEQAWSAVTRLGLGERGLIAGLVAGLFEELGASLTLSLDAPDDAARQARGNVALAFAVSVAGNRGWARLEVPCGWLIDLARSSPGPSGETAAALNVEVRIELARTFIAAGSLAALAPGDAVVFDGVPAARDRSVAPWSVRVVIGEHAADADLGPGGEVTLRGGFRAEGAAVSVAIQGTQSFSFEEVAMVSRTSENIESTAVLAAAPVDVIVEVGRIILRGDEVLGLGPGTVLRLGRERTMTVALRIGGEIWAEGELVDVDGDLGVRVTTPLRIPASGRSG